MTGSISGLTIPNAVLCGRSTIVAEGGPTGATGRANKASTMIADLRTGDVVMAQERLECVHEHALTFRFRLRPDKLRF